MFSDRLPDPDNLINEMGLPDENGFPAPGFSGLNLESKRSRNVFKSRSNRGAVSSDGSHSWSFTISYNPMLKYEFDALESFIFGHDIRINPFKVVLPNYSRPKSQEFINYADNLIVPTYYPEGSTVIEMEYDTSNIDGNTPMPGDLFNIVDNTDAIHQNIYKVTRIETPNRWAEASPSSNNRVRLHIFPSLQREVPTGAKFKFINPEFRVLYNNEVFNYEIDSYERYTFNLEVEEIMPS